MDFFCPCFFYGHALLTHTRAHARARKEREWDGFEDVHDNATLRFRARNCSAENERRAGVGMCARYLWVGGDGVTVEDIAVCAEQNEKMEHTHTHTHHRKK